MIVHGEECDWRDMFHQENLYSRSNIGDGSVGVGEPIGLDDFPLVGL